jgi:hypothetical protein
MDDLALLSEMADRTPLPAAADLAPARAKLMTAATRPKGRRRLLVSSAAVVGLAAAITGMVTLAPLEQGPSAQAGAVKVLRLAADATRALPDTPPRPDQLIYTKTQQGDGDIRETWLSADGTRDGRIEQYGAGTPVPGCRDGQAQVIKGDEPLPGVTEPCTPWPAYQPDLPTTGAAMADYLRARNDGNLNSLGKDIHGLVAEAYVQPAALAAVFEAVTQIDGLTVVDDVTDAAGRPGVGVRWTFDGNAHTLVFDAESHMFLGMADTSAVVGQGFVDEVGQRP